MDLHVLFERYLQKIDILNDFIVLYGKKEETVSDLRYIANEHQEIKTMLLSCMELLKKFQDENLAKCRDIIEKSREQQLIMLHVLEQIIDSNVEKTTENTERGGEREHGCVSPNEDRPISVLTEISNTMTPSKFTLFKPGETISLADYIKSPHTTKRMRPLALQFTDFERTISADEFGKVPGYV